jgi:RNA polymerase sigma-70 factor, ECF subfamily
MDSDQILVERAGHGEALAWETLVKRHRWKIFALCCRHAGAREHAEDLTQEVFLRVFKYLDQYQPDTGSFVSWMIRIAHNLIIDFHRKNRVSAEVEKSSVALEGERETVLEQIPSPLPCPHSQVESSEKRERVRQLMRQLSPLLREALILRYLRELSYREISAVLQVSEGTIKSRINRARLACLSGKKQGLKSSLKLTTA